MQKYRDSAAFSINGVLQSLSAATVTVYEAGTANLSAIYSSNVGAPLANPTATDSEGNFSFYAVDGRYDIAISKTGYTTTWARDVLLEDPATGSSVVITGGSIDSTPIGSTTPSTGAFTTLSASGIVSAPASISLTNAGLATQAHIGGNGSGRVLINAIAGQEVDLQVAGATVLYASGATVGILGNTILGDASTDTLNVGNGGLIKDASGNIGLGVTPTYQLDVRSTLTGTTAGSNRIANLSANASGRDAYLAFGDNVNANAGMGYLSGALYWYANGAERMRLDTAGNLGIGVTPSAWGSGYKSLDVGARSMFAENGGNNATLVANNVYYNGTNWTYKTTAAGSIYTQVGNASFWYGAPSGTAGTTAALTQILQLEQGKTLALEGATSAAGTGIAFPATQLASSNANTLDDYEEGTFTPVLSGTSTAGAGTYTTQVGSYVKVGSKVSFQLNLVWSAHTGTGNLVITGLPFTSSSTIGRLYPFAVYTGGTAMTAGNIMQTYLINSSTSITIEQIPTGGGSSVPVPMDTVGQIMVSGTYFV